MISCFPKLVLSVVYKSKNGLFRGFCSPYDVTCESATAKEAMAKLDSLVDLYEDGLKKYKFPRHLSIKDLTNDEDKKVFSIALNVVSKELKKKVRNSYLNYQLENKKEEIKLPRRLGTVNYFQPCFA